jgi:hypothetical protein
MNVTKFVFTLNETEFLPVEMNKEQCEQSRTKIGDRAKKKLPFLKANLVQCLYFLLFFHLRVLRENFGCLCGCLWKFFPDFWKKMCTGHVKV